MYAIRSYYGPAFQGVAQSMMRSDPFGLHNSFIWFENFVALFTDPLYLRSVGITLCFSAATVITSYSIHYTKLYEDSAVSRSNEKLREFEKIYKK